MNNIKTFLNLRNNLSKKLKLQLNVSLLFIVISTIAELLSISAIIASVTFFLNDGKNLEISLLDKLNIQNVNVYYLILFVFFVYLLKTIVLLFIANYQAKFTTKIAYYFSSRLFNKYTNLKFYDFIKEKTSTYIRNITTDVVKIASFLYHSLFLLNEVFVIGILCMLIFFLDPITFIFLILSISPLIFIYIKKTKKLIYDIGKEMRDSEENKIFLSQQAFFGFKLIKHFSIKNFFLKKYINNEINLTDKYKKIQFWTAVPKHFTDLIIVIILLIFLIINIFQNKNFDEAILLFTAFAAAGLRIAPSLNRILVSLQGIKVAIPSVEYFLNNKLNSLQIKSEKIENKKFLKLNKKLEVKNASFRFSEKDPYLFKNLSFSIPEKSIIGIKGETGSGKSTLVNCLVGQLKFTEGSFVMGEDILGENNISCQNVGLVHQDTFLLNDTIKKNIAIGINENIIDDEKLKNAISIAKLDKFINNLEKKENTFVSENSTNISGGQKQRMCIARAIYFEPQFLIFDEATNALDEFTEKEILDEICSSKKHFSILLISHNDQVLQRCDKIIDLKDYKAN